MNAWVIFRRARITLFSFLVLICVIWAILFAVFLSHEWSHFSRSQKVVVVSLLSLYGFTAVLLYLMVVVHFRLWWDVARVLVLLFVHAGGSELFTLSRHSFPCRGFGTETVCRGFVFTIFIGCWVVSGIILCFAIALGVMAFVPRPVESLPGTEEDGVPWSPASFKAGSPSDERRTISFYSIDSRTGLVSYNNRGGLPEASRSSSPVNGTREETIIVGPPRVRQSFQSPNLGHSNDTSTYSGTISMRNVPRERASVVSGPQRADSLYRNPFRDPSPPPVAIYSRASTIRPGVGGESPSIAEDRPNLSLTFSEPKRDALSSIPLRNTPPPVIVPRDRATEHTSTLYSILSHYSVPASPGDHSQLEQTYPDSARTATPSVYSFYSSAASVHSMWVESTPNVPPPPVPALDIAQYRGPSSFLGPKGPSSGNNNAPLTAKGSNASLKHKVSEPSRTAQHHGELSAHQSYISPVEESPFSRRGSDGQVLDPTQWRRLVLSAAAKP